MSASETTEMIPFNQPFMTGKEVEYIIEAVKSKKISGDGLFTLKCHELLQKRYNFKKILLTTSCTDALEMAAILLDIIPGDEVIIPSYTFVSTANAFVLRGAKIVFADSMPDHPNMDTSCIESLITKKTKAIVPVHYAGAACNMGQILELAKKYDLRIVEDAAQAIDSFYIDQVGVKIPLGTLGEMAAFSFHETKNIIAGEGGMLAINEDRLMKRAEIIREKGTNRSSFFRGEIDKYGWVDIGSSFLPSEIISAFLFAQLEHIEAIQKRRLEIWNIYYIGLKPLEDQGKIKLPILFNYATNNAHMFYIVCADIKERTQLISYLRERNIHGVFHYQSLHQSPYYSTKHDGRELPCSDHFTNCLMRLPLYYELSDEGVERVVETIHSFYKLGII